MTREPIYAALFAKLQAAASFKTTSRRLKHFSDVPAIDQPALYVAQRSESATTVPGQPTVWTMNVDVYLYVNNRGDQNVIPSTLINPLIDAVAASLAPNPIDNKCTLGGLVQHAWIEGQIQTDEGVLGDQAVAVIPVVIKAV